MPLLHIVVLALVQGITEFLPISSSAHLVLVPALTGWPDQGLVIDVATHVGTLVAVSVYFRGDLAAMLYGFARLATGRSGPGSRLALQVLVASLPIFAAGAALHAVGTDVVRSVEVIAWTTLVFGLALGAADRYSMAVRRVEHVTYLDALLVGLAQAVALIPGTSRSGITMTAGRLLGLEREEAARLSLLLSIPAILGAGALAGWDLYRARDLALGLDALWAAALSFAAALVAIAAMMRWLRRASFAPFVVYRILLAAGLFYWLYA
ncbi:MAG: undecaprenyl-diphosphate phosphatase [Alphaproteobacteria bacterium]